MTVELAVERHEADIVVIGAGPAGLAAATEAARAGARVIVVDVFQAAGGQYHMQPATGDGAIARTPQVAAGRAAIARCRAAGAQILTGVEVFGAGTGAGGGFALQARRGAAALSIRGDSLIAATGAMERPLPFKGWTLPGVITAGAAQRLIKTAGTAPGRRVVLAGSGPFLYAVAATFAAASLPIADFVEAARPSPAAVAGLLLRHPGRIAEAARLRAALARTGARRHPGHVVIEAAGDGRLEAVRIAPLDAAGRPQLDRSRLIGDVDTLCIGYGFRAVPDLTAVLGADHRHAEALGGWVCAADPVTGATSVERLYAAGEAVGIGGAVPARLGGALAGHHAARALGFTKAELPVARMARDLARARDFAAGLARLFPYPTQLIADLLPAEEILCRCEDVTRGAVEAALADGARDARSVKMWTRAGMGPCQGRSCGSALAALVARHTGTDEAAAGFNRPHLPLRPVPIGIVEALLAPEDPPPPSPRPPPPAA